jgi:hypothetical protein
MGKERVGEEECGFINGRGALEKLAGVVVVS